MTAAAPLEPAKLRPHYSEFLRVPDGAPRKILLTGHSHQAWPDVAREGQDEAFRDAARFVDDKWSKVFAAQDAVREAIVARIGGNANEYAFAPNTHELVARFLSALDLRARPRIVTTGGEFHSMHRQLRRLAEEGVEIVFVDPAPLATLSERVAAAVNDKTAAVMVSSVLFETAAVVPHLGAVTEAAARHGARVLVDAYHAFTVVPFRVDELPGEPAFVVAGGYKYAEWGEGVCFLRVPEGTTLRPVYTGWFAGYAELSDRRTSAPVGYPADGATAFAGSTFDPTSFYRARAVCRFFAEQGMTVPALRALSLAQTDRILARADALGLSVATPREAAARGGFVSIRSPRAGELVEGLRKQGIYTDSRGELLRLGPAPYVTDAEIDLAMDVLGTLAR